MHWAEGLLALVDGRPREALQHLEQAQSPECRVCGLPELGLAHETLGDTAAARRRYREFIETPTHRRTELADGLHRGWVLARLSGGGPAWSPAGP